MPLNRQDQLTVLADILETHQLDCCGTIAECQQAERIIQSLISKQSSLHSDIKKTLMDVYHYCQTGQGKQNLNAHIEENQTQLTQWVSSLHNELLS